MPRLDPIRREKLRMAIRHLLSKDTLSYGHLTQLADHFEVSRQRVHQVVNAEAQEMNQQRRKLRGTLAAGAIEPTP